MVYICMYARTQEDNSAVLFVVDTSGSMGETTAVEGRLKLRGAEAVSTKNDAPTPHPPPAPVDDVSSPNSYTHALGKPTQ